MKRGLKYQKSFKEAEEWDIEQQITMTSQERQEAAKILKERVYGKKNKDVRKSVKNDKR